MGGMGGMGGMVGGMMLGYLLTHYLIDQNQYNLWRNLDDDQLRETLISQGILNDSDYNHLANQAQSGDLPYDQNDTNDSGWTNDNNDYTDTTSYNDNSGWGGDDFGGFDQ